MNVGRRKCIVCKKNVSSNYKYHVALCFSYYKLNAHKQLYSKLYNTPVQTYVKTLQKNQRLKDIWNNINEINSQIKNIIKNKYKYNDETLPPPNRQIEYRQEQQQQQQQHSQQLVTTHKYNQDDMNKKYEMLNKMKKILKTQTELLYRYQKNNNSNFNSNSNFNFNYNSNFNSSINLQNRTLFNNVISSTSRVKNNISKLYSQSSRTPQLQYRNKIPRNQLQLKYSQVYMHDYEALVKGKSLIIVGPSKTVLRKKNADFINSFDLVVRLNKILPIPYHMEQFIGYRTDILYNNCNTTDHGGENNLSINMLVNNNVRYLRASYPPIGVFKKDIDRFRMLNRSRGFPFGHVNTKYYNSVVKKLNTRPYTGTLAILDLLRYDIKALYITGIDFFKYNYHSSYRVLNKEDMMKTRNGPIHKREPQINLLRQIYLTDKRIKVDDVLENVLLEKYNVFYNKILQSQQSYFSRYLSSINTSESSSNFYLHLWGYNISNDILTELENLQLSAQRQNTTTSLFYLNRNSKAQILRDSVNNPDINTKNINFNEINKRNIPSSIVNYSKRIFNRKLSDDCLIMIILSGVIKYYNRTEASTRHSSKLQIILNGFDLYNKKSRNIEEYLLYKYLRYQNIIKN